MRVVLEKFADYVPLCQPNCAAEFSIFAFSAQVVIDIVGYFKAPAGATFSSGITVGAGTTSIAGNVGIGTINPVSGRLHVEGGANNGVYGHSTNAIGVYGTSTLFEGVRGEAFDVNHGGVVGVHNSGGIAVFGTSAGTGVGGFSAAGFGVAGTSTTGTGVFGVSGSATGVGVFARNYDGLALYAEGHAAQARDKSGIVKAMIFVNQDATIARCYNGFQLSTSGNCGFSVAHPATGVYDVNFGYQISDRFVIANRFNNEPVGGCYAGSIGPEVPSANVVRIITGCTGLLDGPFVLIVF